MLGLFNVDIKNRAAKFSDLAESHGLEQRLPLLLSQKITESHMVKIRQAVAKIICARAGLPQGSFSFSQAEVAEITPILKKMVENNVGNVIELGDEAYLPLTNELRSALHDFITASGFSDSLLVVQRFPNIRVKIGPFSEKQEHYSHPLSTSKMHCDIWAGADPALLICILEIFNADGGPKIDFAELKTFPKSLNKKQPAYDTPKTTKFLKNNIKNVITSKDGHMHVLDAYTPHQTTYPGDGLRISIDFRVALKHSAADKIPDVLRTPQFTKPCGWKSEDAEG